MTRYRGGGGYRGRRPGGRRRRPVLTDPTLNQDSRVATASREVVIPERGGSVAELADLFSVPATQILKALLLKGRPATLNSALDYDTASMVAENLGIEVLEPEEDESEVPAASKTAMERHVLEEEEESLESRPPVVTIMGHVDHGKTSLLDAIRQTRVAEGEAGGITQHIGAYQVEHQGRTITFIDTPGHAAFTEMRARGAQVTDVAIIVVAADDGVMPQTREAIDHAKAAGVPMIVAINKIDLASANPDRVKQELADLGVVVTEYGGKIEAIPVSARTQEGLDTLLETILLVAEAEVEPKANPDRPAAGAVVESKMDKSRGAVGTFLVQRGTLHVGDMVVAGQAAGRVKALFDDRGQRVTEAPPAFQVEVLGVNGVPAAGDRFQVVADERTGRAMVEAALGAGQRDGEGDLSLEAVFARIRSGAIKELTLIVKADVQGSVEPIVNSLEKLGEQGETRVKVIHAGLGNVNVTNVNLAVASKAMIIAFNVKTEDEARRVAEFNGVTIREYNVIYTLIEDIEKMLTGMLEPRYQEVIHGHAEVRQIFKAGRRTIAGCVVSDGVIHRRDRVRVKRGSEQQWEGGIGSLKRFKDDVNEVREGFECGIALDGWDELAEGDTMEMFSSERV